MTVYAVQTMTLCLMAVFCTSLAQRPELDLNKTLVNHTLGNITNVWRPTVFSVDLRSGISSFLPYGVTWQSRLTADQQTCACDRQGVLKLTFNRYRRRAEINMTFEYSHGYTFDVGDSVSNSGYGGDYGTQDYDAEVHSFNNRIYFYGRDNPAGGTYGLLHSQPDYVGVQPYTTLTLNIADELATADNGDHYLYINSYKLFGLNGQSDSSPGGVNRDVYLGMNRVVAGSYMSGRGLCNVRVRFYPS
ncbi:uncharacterized protein LOC143300683 [Babylonia areolata]|uniref:uncharacterized protein LOC143300683 n=1 Tax=Babylonia areolata TaxID=304850 RepID=UPI003FD55D08